MKKLILLGGAIMLILPLVVSAKIGVGVGTGKIQVDQSLKAGLIYTLPPLTVINTGDEPSQYGVGLQYRDKQSELIPPKEWFSFEPLSFYLEPGQIKIVQVKLTLPVAGAKPGDYFAFLQGFPEKKIGAEGSTSVGVAAASKLYFTVTPANIFVGLYYRTVSLLKQYSPWGYVVLAVILAAIFISLFRRFFAFNIGIKPKKEKE